MFAVSVSSALHVGNMYRNSRLEALQRFFFFLVPFSKNSERSSERTDSRGPSTSLREAAAEEEESDPDQLRFGSACLC